MHRQISGHEWPKRILAPIAFFLKTRNPTDTVDRLFDSRHVNDLRLIAASAFVAAIVVFLVAGMNAIAFCAADWPKEPFENTAKLIAFIANKGGKHFLSVFAPTAAVFGGILAWAYQTGSNRLGVVDLFACEIDTLCRMVTVANLASRLTDDAQGPLVAAHFTSEENYFPILDGNSAALQSLEAVVVSDITAFYTYMKAVRDSFRRSADAKPNEAAQAMTSLIYMLYLGLESGRLSSEKLVEFEPTRTERIMVVLLSELKAYQYLREFYTAALKQPGRPETPEEERAREENELYFKRLVLRGPGYITEMKAIEKRLTKPVKDPARNPLDDALLAARQGRIDPDDYAQNQWAKALQTLDILTRRYQQLNASVGSLECKVEGIHITAGVKGDWKPLVGD